jgi:uncharacterized LabA/DUF88 family protein
MIDQRDRDLNLAVLIDADNVPYSNIKGMMEEIAKYGTPTFKRIYGDWTKPTVSGWKGVLLEHAITPIQQYSYTSGKNATDSAMIIDAMDILYSGKVDGFCIISSDSDFTRLAIRLREARMKVIGIGEKKTPNAFISACDKFIYIEILAEELKSEDEDQKGSAPAKKSAAKAKETLRKIDRSLIKLVKSSIDDIADDDGWSFLGELGSLLIKKRSNFDPRNYGFTKLGPLIKSIPGIEVDERDTGKGNVKHIFVRLR